MCADEDSCDYDANNDADSDTLCSIEECYDDPTFDAGFGFCRTYEAQNPNFIYCRTDGACNACPCACGSNPDCNVDQCPTDALNDADSDAVCANEDSCAQDTWNDADSDGVCDGDVIDCEGDWQAWGACTESCGGGITTRTFAVTQQPTEEGSACVAADGEVESGSCNNATCPADCVGAWAQWGSCNRTCGGGLRERSFNVTTFPSGGGVNCSTGFGQEHLDLETQECNTQCCDVDDDAACDEVDSCALDALNDVDGDGLCGNVDSCARDGENDADSDMVCGDDETCPYDLSLIHI